MGHKFGKGGAATVLGALAGGFAAHTVEKKAGKEIRKRRERELESDSESDRDVAHGDRRRRGSRRGSAPAPLGALFRREGSRRSKSRRRDDSDSDDSRRHRRH